MADEKYVTEPLNQETIDAFETLQAAWEVGVVGVMSGLLDGENVGVIVIRRNLPDDEGALYPMAVITTEAMKDRLADSFGRKPDDLEVRDGQK